MKTFDYHEWDFFLVQYCEYKSSLLMVPVGLVKMKNTSDDELTLIRLLHSCVKRSLTHRKHTSCIETK